MSADFIDSNVFVYLFDDSAPEKRTVAENIVFNALESETADISFQVVQETLNVITSKIKNPATADEAKQFLEYVLLPLWRGLPTSSLYYRAIDIQTRYQYGFYDALILSAAMENGCTRLLTEDLQDGQKIEDLTIVNPF